MSMLDRFEGKSQKPIVKGVLAGAAVFLTQAVTDVRNAIADDSFETVTVHPLLTPNEGAYWTHLKGGKNQSISKDGKNAIIVGSAGKPFEATLTCEGSIAMSYADGAPGATRGDNPHFNVKPPSEIDKERGERTIEGKLPSGPKMNPAKARVQCSPPVKRGSTRKEETYALDLEVEGVDDGDGGVVTGTGDGSSTRPIEPVRGAPGAAGGIESTSSAWSPTALTDVGVKIPFSGADAGLGINAGLGFSYNDIGVKSDENTGDRVESGALRSAGIRANLQYGPKNAQGSLRNQTLAVLAEPFLTWGSAGMDPAVIETSALIGGGTVFEEVTAAGRRVPSNSDWIMGGSIELAAHLNSVRLGLIVTLQGSPEPALTGAFVGGRFEWRP